MKNFITIIFALLSFGVVAQTTISGIIKEKSGETIIGANIFIKGSYEGTSSDVDGKFSFVTNQTGKVTLSFSYMGFKPIDQVHVLGQGDIELDITMKMDVSSLGEVIITAGTFEAGDSKRVESLNSLDIVTVAGANADVIGALGTLPGTQRNGESGQLLVRGGAAYETRTFMDGTFVQNPYSSSVSNVPSRGRFSPFLFKGTSFSTGGYSAEYGQALSSALVLNTVDLAPETVTGFSLMSVGLGMSHTERWKEASLSASLDYVNLKPYTSIFPQIAEWNKPYEGINGQIIYRKKTSNTGIFKLYATANTNHFGLALPDSRDVSMLSDIALKNKNYLVQSSYKEILGEKWTIFFSGAYTHNTDLISSEFVFDQKESTIQSKATLKYQLNENIAFKTGGLYLNNQFDETYQGYSSDEFRTKLREQFVATFLESNIYFSKKLIGRVGGRLEHSALLDRSNLAYRISLAYKTGEHQQVSFATGNFHQTPENELLRYGQDLDFEKATHYILNYQITKGDRTIRAEAYLKKYDDLAKFDPVESWKTNNSGDGFARGIDIFYRDKETIRRGDFWISYSFLDTERDHRDYPYRAMPEFASKHNLAVVYKQWIQPINTSLGMSYAFSSPRPYNDPNNTAFNAGRTQPFHDLSLSLSYITTIKEHYTVFHFSANNLLFLNNQFGYQFSQTPNEAGIYDSAAIRPTANNTFFAGVFISIGKKKKNTGDITQ